MENSSLICKTSTALQVYNFDAHVYVHLRKEEHNPKTISQVSWFPDFGLLMLLAFSFFVLFIFLFCLLPRKRIKYLLPKLKL